MAPTTRPIVPDWIFEQYREALAEQINKPPLFSFLKGVPAGQPMQGPPTPFANIDSLSVTFEDGHIRICSGGWEAETAELDAADVDALIDFLQTWRPRD